MKTLHMELYNLILDYMIGLESMEDAQRQSIYAELEAAKATLRCLESVRTAIDKSYKEKH